MTLVYEKSHTPEDSGTQPGTESQVETWLEQKVNALIIGSVPDRDCPQDSKKVIVVYEYMRVADAANERTQIQQSELTGSIVPQPGPLVTVVVSDWVYVLHWRVEIHCISEGEIVGVEDDGTGADIGGRDCGNQSTKKSTASGVSSGASSAQEAQDKAQEKAIARIFKLLNSFVSSINCPENCGAKVYSYSMGDASYKTTPSRNSQGRLEFKSIATIPYRFEVFCLPPTARLKALASNSEENEVEPGN